MLTLPAVLYYNEAVLIYGRTEALTFVALKENYCAEIGVFNSIGAVCSASDVQDSPDAGFTV